MTVAIHVREVDGHAGVAGFTDGERGREPEISVSVVEPELIGVLEVVADIEVGGAVAIHVVEARGEREIVGLLDEWFSVHVEKSRRRERHAREMPCAVVEKEEVGLGALRAHDTAELRMILDAVVLFPLIGDDVSVTDFLHGLIEAAHLRRIDVERVAGLVRADVQIDVAVAVHVGERHRGRSEARRKATARGCVCKVSLPVPEPQLQGATERADDEIELAVAVHVSECRARRRESLRVDPARLRDVREMETAVILVQRGGALDGSEEQIGEAVAVDVTRGDAGPDQQLSIAERVLVVDVVAVGDACGGRPHRLEPRASSRRYVERAPRIAAFVVPGDVDGPPLLTRKGDDRET